MSNPDYMNGANEKSKQLKPYRKDGDYSYTLGAFPTFELIEARAGIVREVLIHSRFTDSDKLKSLCRQRAIPFRENDRLIARLSKKDNCLVIGTFNKYQSALQEDRPHLVLVNPRDMGNLGTILRTAAGLGFFDVAIIQPAADIFAPKTVRASMGAIFRLSFRLYQSFQDYRQEFYRHKIFTFMTGRKRSLDLESVPPTPLYSLVFGNEAAGLDDSYFAVGTSVYIPQTEQIDSFNLPIAAGIGMYAFSQKNPQPGDKDRKSHDLQV